MMTAECIQYATLGSVFAKMDLNGIFRTFVFELDLAAERTVRKMRSVSGIKTKEFRTATVQKDTLEMVYSNVNLYLRRVMFVITAACTRLVDQISGNCFLLVIMLLYGQGITRSLFREPSKYECSCNPGFFGDGFVCTPERNCVNIPILCDPNAQCVSTTTGYQCVCNQGFIGNGSICNTAPRLDSGFLLISQGVANVRVPFNGARGVPVAMAQMAIGVDKDCAEGRIYWSDISAKQIFSCKYDGTDRKPFITKDIISPEGVAVDWISRRLYWTDSAKDTIEVASLENSTLRAVIISKYLINPRGIAVDPHQSKLYWSDWNREGPKIEWANLDGTERELLVSEPRVELPNSIQIAPETGELCYADAGTKKIECVDTYTKQIRTVASNLTYPFGLAVTDDHYYWTDWTT